MGKSSVPTTVNARNPIVFRGAGAIATTARAGDAVKVVAVASEKKSGSPLLRAMGAKTNSLERYTSADCYGLRFGDVKKAV